MRFYEIIPPDNYENRNGFNNHPLIDALTKKEKQLLEKELITRLSSEDELDKLVVETLAYLKSSNSLYLLNEKLANTSEPTIKLTIAWAIFEIIQDNKMVGIVLDSIKKIDNKSDAYYVYKLTDAFYKLAKFHNVKIDLVLKRYTSRSEFLLAYNAERALRIAQEIKEFNNFWNENYPESLPIGHELRIDYSERWFRIHNFQDSKRYAQNDGDYELLLNRQNQLITDLFGKGTEFFILFGMYDGDKSINKNYWTIPEINESVSLKVFELHNLMPGKYKEGTIYRVFGKTDIWESNKINNILKAIADDEIRAIFISSSRNCIIAPYDGGVDIIVKTTQLRDEQKLKYQAWLSAREDCL